MYIALALSVLVTVVVADKPFFPLPVLPRPRQPLPTCPNQGIDPLFGCENSRQCSSNFHCPLHSYCCEYGGCGDTRCQEAISPTDVVCYLPSDSGNCYAYFVRWYFNIFTGRCERFIYGGCGGNGNNFQTEQQCYDRCQTNQYLYPRGRGHTIYPRRRRSKY